MQKYPSRLNIPEVKGKIYRNTIKNVVYINYEYDRVYKPDKRYNIPKRSSCLRIGANLVIQKIIRDYKLDEILEPISC